MLFNGKGFEGKETSFDRKGEGERMAWIQRLAWQRS